MWKSLYTQKRSFWLFSLYWASFVTTLWLWVQSHITEMETLPCSGPRGIIMPCHWRWWGARIPEYCSCSEFCCGWIPTGHWFLLLSRSNFISGCFWSCRDPDITLTILVSAAQVLASINTDCSVSLSLWVPWLSYLSYRSKFQQQICVTGFAALCSKQQTEVSMVSHNTELSSWHVKDAVQVSITCI